MDADQPGQGVGVGVGSGLGVGKPGTELPATASISSSTNSRTLGSNSLSLVACFIFYQSSLGKAKPPLGGFSNMHADQPPPGAGSGCDGAPGTVPPATASISAGANSRTLGSNSLSLVSCFAFYPSFLERPWMQHEIAYAGVFLRQE